MTTPKQTLPALLMLVALCAKAQPPLPVSGPPLPRLPYLSFAEGPLTLHTSAIANRPFTVTGAGGAILGMQDGTSELWQFPVKVFSGLHLRAELDGYGVPIDLNSNAATLDVSPGHSTLTYSHSGVTVRQHMFVPAGEVNGRAGGVILFEIHSIAPLTLTVQLTPAMQAEWPAPQYGQPSWDWQPMGTDSGAWKLNTDNPNFFGMIAMPGAKPGVYSPYQEHPRTLPLEFRLRYDPKTDAGSMFPLICELSQAGEKNNRIGIAALEQRLVDRVQQLPDVWRRTQESFAHYFDTRLTVHTPDAAFDRAIAWAELAIETSQATTVEGETGLVAGWFPSFDSARPGFGWYFGRDTLWSQYAINSYGDAALARRSMDFLMARQRADGKMMHEYSQSAALLTGDMTWNKLEYEYAAADATPLFLMAMQDYVRSTNDVDYLRKHWDNVSRAYTFESTHDSDGDGVYDNKEGTGWVEGWPPRAPHQELYLASLDREATTAMAQLARWTSHDDVAAAADQRALKLRTAVEGYRESNGLYAFSRNLDGTYDPTRTVYPSVALWNSADGLAAPQPMLREWSTHHFATDWGVRAVADDDRIYDANSYHQGAVWPLFTGWTAMAKYRTGHAMAAYRDLRQNIDLTWVQDPGAVTELLSGRFYQPLGRSSTHQLWSSAMVLTPAVRGLFGLESDAPHHALIVHPHLPAGWNEVRLQNYRVGDVAYRIHMQRQGAHLLVHADSDTPTVLCLRAQGAVRDDDAACSAKATTSHELALPLPTVEASLELDRAAEFGDETVQPKIVDEQATPRGLTLSIEALAGSTVTLRLYRNGEAHVFAEGGDLQGDLLQVHMPPSSAPAYTNTYVSRTLQLRW